MQCQLFTLLFSQAKDHIAKQKVAARAGRALDKAVNSFFAELKNHDFNALYFSRAPGEHCEHTGGSCPLQTPADIQLIELFTSCSIGL